MYNKKPYNRPQTAVEALTISPFMKDALSWTMDGGKHDKIVDGNPPYIEAKPNHFNIWEESEDDDQF